MITTCKQLREGQEVYARIHTSDEEAVRGDKYPEGTIECRFTEEPTKDDMAAAKVWIDKQIEETGILKKRPHLEKKLTYVGPKF